MNKRDFIKTSLGTAVLALLPPSGAALSTISPLAGSLSAEAQAIKTAVRGLLLLHKSAVAPVPYMLLTRADDDALEFTMDLVRDTSEEALAALESDPAFQGYFINTSSRSLAEVSASVDYIFDMYTAYLRHWGVRVLDGYDPTTEDLAEVSSTCRLMSSQSSDSKGVKRLSAFQGISRNTFAVFDYRGLNACDHPRFLTVYDFYKAALSHLPAARGITRTFIELNSVTQSQA